MDVVTICRRMFLFFLNCTVMHIHKSALIAQLGERQTEDLKVLCSIHSQGNFLPNFMSRGLTYIGWMTDRYLFQPLTP
eukprot:scaffold3108_cov152-Cylindrotheca_fusiformis.AAC.11